MSGKIDISREAVAEIMRQGSLPLRAALIIPALCAALDAQGSPLAEVAMRERAAMLVHYRFSFHCAAEVRALPTTFTHAELLAAAAELPEVKALVDAVKALEMWDSARGYPIPYRIRDPLRTALAPFTRKGE